MTKVNQVYRCLICGNTVKVIKAGAGELVCCGQPMKLIKKKVI
jgi:superoxide reductase